MAAQCTFRPKPSKVFPKKISLKKPALKKFLIFFQKKPFLLYPEMESWTFRPQPPKFFLKENFLYFFLKNLLRRNFLYFLGKAPNFLETEIPKNS